LTTLTPLELAIMKSLWKRGSARVKEVREDLYAERGLAYTTVMTIMDRLFKKGIVSRRKAGRAHVYEAAFSEATIRADALEVLLESFFDGSETALRHYLEDRSGPDPERDLAPEVPSHPIDDSLL
jgi:BlaI family penicillinase repressor